MFKKLYITLLLCTFLFSCTKSEQNPNPIQEILESEHPLIKNVVDNLNNHEVQILFTKIKHGEAGNVIFKDYEFQVDSNTYFYPASSVKFPVAILALEKLNELEEYNRSTEFQVQGDTIKTNFSKEIEKLFAVSNNEAYNRLFEFLGQDDINKRLNKKSITSRISHRVSVANSDNIITKPIIFFTDSINSKISTSITSKPIKNLSIKRLKKGKGFIANDSLVNSPMDFSKKNYLPLTSLHNSMKRLVFPEKYSPEEQFNISEEDRQFLLKSMSQKPRALGYDPNEYYDSYVKFLVFGDEKDKMPKHIEIYNKVGYAYGTLTDCAYIVNKKNNTSCIITATLLVNANGIFNDNNYEYESVGIPFLAELGRQLIAY